MTPLPNTRFFAHSLRIIAVLVIIWLLTKLSFLLNPVVTLVRVLFVPLMLTGFLYYLMRPLVEWLKRRKAPASLAILSVYLCVAALFATLGSVVWPLLREQVQSLADNVPALVEQFGRQLNELRDNRLFSSLIGSGTEWPDKLAGWLDQGARAVTDYLSRSVSAVTSFVIVISTIPFILYYLLKDGHKLPVRLLRFVPRPFRRDVRQTMGAIDDALSGYIVGRVIITLLLTLMMYVGFLVIELPYALVLATVSFLFNLIPYIGQFVGAIPCLIVAFIDSPIKALWVLLIILIAQQIEGSLIAPHVYGRKLDIHPLTSILLLLVSADLMGIVGIVAAVPIYMTVKIIVLRLYRLFLRDKVEELVE